MLIDELKASDCFMLCGTFPLCETEPVLMFAIQSVPFLQRMLVLYI